MNGNTRTHKYEDAIGIIFPTLGILVVFFLCGFEVYGEEWSRAVTKIGFYLRWLRWSARCWLRGLHPMMALIAFDLNWFQVCELM
jgi:hypothetical protein